jgi:hypothetical protein
MNFAAGGPALTLHSARGVAHPPEIDDVETGGDAMEMIARCARHQHPELFGGREVPPEELPNLGYEAVPPGFNAEGILPDEAAAA